LKAMSSRDNMFLADNYSSTSNAIIRGLFALTNQKDLGLKRIFQKVYFLKIFC
jgi:hypothetical protein